jgi:hypothetical protein
VIGEASGDFLPWAYPFNWRALSERLNDSPSGFGRPDQTSTQFGMADGSVRTLSQDVDPQILRAWAAAPPIATPEQIATPPRPASYRWSGVRREYHHMTDDYSAESLINTKSGTVEIAIQQHDKDRNESAARPTASQIEKFIVSKFPNTVTLAAPIILDAKMAAVIGRLSRLRVLEVARIRPDPEVMAQLRALKALRVLQAESFPGDDLERLQKALPEVVVKPHSRDF